MTKSLLTGRPNNLCTRQTLITEVCSELGKLSWRARMRPVRYSATVDATERCESGRIGLTANELTWETGSGGSNPPLSAR